MDDAMDGDEAIGYGTGIDKRTEIERQHATHREKFALKRKKDLQKKRALAQYGPDGPGKGPPDPEPPTGQRMAVNE
jgi:hypothetical protein